MIFGNPSEFALQIDIVPEWCNANFCEGLFCLYLDRQRLSPSRIYTDSLNIAIRQFLYGLEAPVCNVLKPVSLSDSLLEKNGKELFLLLNEITYPVDATDHTVNNCWDYVISPDVMTDRGFNLFIYKNNEREILMGGSMDAEIVVSVSMPVGTTLAIAKKAYAYLSSVLPVPLGTSSASL